MTEWVELLQVGTNIKLLLALLGLTRKFSRIELKVDTMWSVFMRRFGSREQDIIGEEG